MDYEYTVIKEQNTNSWKINYKGKPTILKETVSNRDDLIRFRNSVNDGKMLLIKLSLSVFYFLLGITIINFLYKKNKQLLKEGGLIIGIGTCTAVYFAIKVLVDLSRTVRDIEYFYLTLTI